MRLEDQIEGEPSCSQVQPTQMSLRLGRRRCLEVHLRELRPRLVGIDETCTEYLPRVVF